MDNYDTKSCNALEKPYYQPIEAALRWCGLALHEVAILKATGDNVLPRLVPFRDGLACGRMQKKY